MLGWCLFFCGGEGGVTHLALSPPFFVALLLFCYCFVIVLLLFCYCFVIVLLLFCYCFTCLVSFCFLRTIFSASLSFSLACHSLSVYLSIYLYIYIYRSLSLSLFLCFLSSFLVFCLWVCLACVISLLVFHEVIVFLFLLVFHEISNCKIFNLTGFFHKSFLCCGFQRATSPDP